MATTDYLQKIAIVGASGNVGAAALKSLLEINKRIQVTVISRADSNATFPDSPQVTVKKGSYDDEAFLQSTFAGHDLAMFALNFTADHVQPKLIDAAAKAGVKWLITNEYAGDGLNHVHRTGSPLYQSKIDALKQVEELAKTHKDLKWIGITTSIWTEIGVGYGSFGTDVKNRVTTLWSDAGPFNSSSSSQVGRGIAKLLSLPVTSATNPRASLQHYANNFAYISSFVLTQQKVFDAVKRVTGTADADWKIVHTTSEEHLKAAQASEDRMSAAMATVMVNYMQKDRGGCYEPKAKEDREILGLQEEDLDEVVKKTLGV